MYSCCFSQTGHEVPHSARQQLGDTCAAGIWGAGADIAGYVGYTVCKRPVHPNNTHLSVPDRAHVPTHTGDRDALLQVKNALDPAPIVFSAWTVESDPCADNWRGIICDCTFGNNATRVRATLFSHMLQHTLSCKEKRSRKATANCLFPHLFSLVSHTSFLSFPAVAAMGARRQHLCQLPPPISTAIQGHQPRLGCHGVCVCGWVLFLCVCVFCIPSTRGRHTLWLLFLQWGLICTSCAAHTHSCLFSLHFPPPPHTLHTHPPQSSPPHTHPPHTPHRRLGGSPSPEPSPLQSATSPRCAISTYKTTAGPSQGPSPTPWRRSKTSPPYLHPTMG